MVRADFAGFVASGAVALTEGAVVERIRRDPAIALDPQVATGGLVYDPEGRARLTEIHREYVASARAAGLPILTFTDTWRCSQPRVEASRFRGRPVNEDNARFLLGLRERTFGDGPPVFVAGLLGPSGDAYAPADSLSRDAARAFHRPQAEALASAGVDLLFLATAPAVEEALGAAEAMAATGLPYVVSFVIRRTGVVLDGAPLGAAMARIDAEATRPPAGFAVNCVHARVLEQALAAHPGAARRLLAFQANTGDLEVEDLDGADALVTESAAAFSDSLDALRRRFGLRVLGGCCGTDGAHIEALAHRLACSPAGPGA